MVDIFPLAIGRKEYFEKTSAKVSLVGKGWHQVQVSFNQFNYDQTVRAFWRFIDKIRFIYNYLSEQQAGEICGKGYSNTEVRSISVNSQIYSKAGNVGERITYEVVIENLLDGKQVITVSKDRYGKESMKTVIEQDVLLLEPNIVAKVSVVVEIDDQIAPGGFEIQKFKF
ncbi:MAG: hypothetical protein ACQEWV_17600 [Bacillota bacterium]